MKKINELKSKALTKIFFGEMEGKKHKGSGLMEFVLVIAIAAALYLLVSGKGETLVNKLWTWVNTKVGTITG